MKTYLAVLQSKNTKYEAAYVGLKIRSSGRSGRDEVDIRLEKQSVVESTGVHVTVKIKIKVR